MNLSPVRAAYRRFASCLQLAISFFAISVAAGATPNIVLIMTDDQGYGDLGCHGNTQIRTPNLDRLHGESLRLTQYHHAPVCSPTRASLLTGRYNYRTGVVDTFIGRSNMHADEVTIAEVLREHGYRTGIFGKWHLGDCYPLRAMDQGFEESLVHAGGGISQPSDMQSGRYFDPWLRRDGALFKAQGYCTDIFTDAAIEFLHAHRNEPFFLYLSTNAPHTPLEVDDKYAQPYREMGFDEQLARLYGMVSNIDENVGRLLSELDRLGLRENTIVVFTTDNGPQEISKTPRYNAGMRGVKGTVYQGGIRVPCFLRWPGRLAAGLDQPVPAAHIDMLPTLLALAGIDYAPDAKHLLDGVNLYPYLRGMRIAYPDRALFFQWHRGDVPEAFRNAAVRYHNFKLVNGTELYDVAADPAEAQDLAAVRPELVEELRARYLAWFEDVSRSRGYDPPHIVLGHPRTNPVRLTPQDWRGTDRFDGSTSAWWPIEVERAGKYDVTVILVEPAAPGTVTIAAQGAERSAALIPASNAVFLQGIRLERGPQRLSFRVESPDPKARVFHVLVERRGR